MLGSMQGLAQVRRTMAATVGVALDLALPAECVGCRREGPPLCRTCRPALDVRRHAAPGVALGLPGELPAPLLQLEWCAPFSGVARRALHALKYGGERRLATPLGEAMADRWAVAGAGGTVLVPVPASPDRVRRRGYDQAVLLARVAADRLGLPVLEILERSRSTAAQFDLDRTARGSNVAGAFRLAPGSGRRGSSPATASQGPRGEWVVLVDDVMTTGSTLAACAATLLEAGAIGASAFTVARER
ncbi:MAG: ComF family protein [Chloroflexota bacterium]